MTTAHKARRDRIVAHDGHAFEAWRCDAVANPKGGIVVLHAVYGLTSHIGLVCAQWAAAGYSAVAPALFDRVERGAVHPYDRAGADAGIVHYAALSQQQILADIQSCVEALGPSNKVAISGFCTGGTWAWRAAALLDFGAQVNFYGSHVPQHLQLRPRCPTIMHYGDNDTIMPMDLVQQIITAHPQVEMHIYSGAGHAFFNPEQDHPDPAAAAQAWTRSVAFMDKHVGGSEGRR